VSAGLGVLAAAVPVFAAAALIAAGLGALLYGPLRHAARRLPPAAEAGLLLVVAAAPALAGLALAALALAPSLTHLIGLGTDHYHVQGHHAHLSPTQAPLWTGGRLDWLILSLAGLGLLALGGDLPRRLGRVRRVARTLEALRLPGGGPHASRVANFDAPLALTAGLIRPRIYLSARLVEALSETELAVVMGHEQAHRRRRDGLRLLAAEVLSRLHLPPVRRRLLCDLTLATERACDEEAALASGRLGVAGTLLKVARLTAARPLAAEPLFPTLTGGDLAARVEALLRPAPASISPLAPRSLPIPAAGLLLTLGWFHADALHHGVESALHLLLIPH
jgi:Zn-dependent protease with chaperone function